MLNSTWQGRYPREDLISHLFSEILPPAVQKPQKIRTLLARTVKPQRNWGDRLTGPQSLMMHMSPTWKAALRVSWGDALQRVLPLLCSPRALRKPTKCILSSQTPCQPTQTGFLSSPLLPQVPGSSFPQALPEAEKAALEKTCLILSGVCPFLVDREIKTFL